MTSDRGHHRRQSGRRRGLVWWLSVPVERRPREVRREARAAEVQNLRVVTARASSETAVSAREAEVLAAVADHLTNAEIAAPPVHLGPHRREPRLLAAAQAPGHRPAGAGPGGRGRPGRADADVAGPPPAAPLPTPLTTFVGRQAEPADARRGARRAPAGHRGRPGRGGQDPARAPGRRRGRRTGSPTACGSSTWCRSPTRRWSRRAVAAALGLGESQGRTVEDVLTGWLAARHVLLVLDNCEHVLDGGRRPARAAARRLPAAHACWPPAAPGCCCRSSGPSRCPASR